MLIIETGILMELIWGCNYYIRMPVYLPFKIYDYFHQITVMKQYFKFKFKFDTNNEVNNGEKIKDIHLLHFLVSFHTPWKHQKTWGFLKETSGIKRVKLSTSTSWKKHDAPKRMVFFYLLPGHTKVNLGSLQIQTY